MQSEASHMDAWFMKLLRDPTSPVIRTKQGPYLAPDTHARATAGVLSLEKALQEVVSFLSPFGFSRLIAVS